MTIWWRSQHSFCHDPQSYFCSKLLAKSSSKKTTSTGVREFELIQTICFPERYLQGPSSKPFKEAVLSWDSRECSVTNKGEVERQGPRAGQLSQGRTSLGDPQVPKPSLPKTERAKGTNSEQLPDKLFSGYQLFFPGKLKATCGEVQEALVLLKSKSIPMLIHITQCIWEKLLSFAYTEIGPELFITAKEPSNREKLVWWKWQPSSQSYPQNNLVKTDRECSKRFQ